MRAEKLHVNIINSGFDASSEAARNRSSLSLYLGLEVFSTGRAGKPRRPCNELIARLDIGLLNIILA